MKRTFAVAAAGLLAMGVGAALAELPEEYSSVEPPSDEHPLDEIISGYEFRDPSIQQMQDDEFENPGFLLMDAARDLWAEADGANGESCQGCHGDVEDMVGLGATFPKFVGEGEHRTFRNVENQINACRERMGAEPWRYDSDESLGMTALLRHQDYGEPVNVTIDGEAEAYFRRGEELYYQRVGQLDMACAHCHEANYGYYIRADHLSQGQSNGFPTYRFKWSGMGSLHRRFSGCIKNIRGVPYAKGSDDFLALELYLAWRGQGLPVEAPSVRN